MKEKVSPILLRIAGVEVEAGRNDKTLPDKRPGGFFNIKIFVFYNLQTHMILTNFLLDLEIVLETDVH